MLDRQMFGCVMLGRMGRSLKEWQSMAKRRKAWQRVANVSFFATFCGVGKIQKNLSGNQKNNLKIAIQTWEKLRSAACPRN
jgi:hypothetical protein